MSSLYRALNDAAFDFNLNKNQLLVFHALMNQTLGYGKTSDPLTDKRLSELTGIRMDRLRPAINVIIKKGLFDSKPHKRFGREYSIGKSYLEVHQERVYTPSVPKKRSPSENENPQNRITKNGENFTQTGQNQPEKATHTITNQTLSQPQQPQTKPSQTKKHILTQQPPQTKTEKQIFTVPQPQPQTQSVKLFFAELEHIPNNFAIETSAHTRVEFAIGNHHDSNATTKLSAEPIADASIEPPATTSPETIATLKKLLALADTEKTDTVANAEIKVEPEVEIEPESEPEPIVTPPITVTTANREEEPPTMAMDTEPEPEPTVITDDMSELEVAMIALSNKPMTQPTATVAEKPIPLPTAVGKENQRACNHHFRQLDREKQKNVVLAFDYAIKQGSVKDPVGYFISLVTSAKNGCLTVPTGAIVNAPPSAEQIEADRIQQRHDLIWSDFTWLRNNAELQQVDMRTLAKQMGADMEEAYALFGEGYALSE